MVYNIWSVLQGAFDHELDMYISEACGADPEEMDRREKEDYAFDALQELAEGDAEDFELVIHEFFRC